MTNFIKWREIRDLARKWRKMLGSTKKVVGPSSGIDDTLMFLYFLSVIQGHK